MRIESNIKDVIDGFTDFEREQIPYIQMLTANNIAFDVLDSARKDVRNRFSGKDLSRAIRVKKATKARLYAEVYINNNIRWRENALTALGFGGDRSRKSMEKAMMKAGLMRRTEILVRDGKVASWVDTQIMLMLTSSWKVLFDFNKKSRKARKNSIKKSEKSKSNFFIVTSSHMAMSRVNGKVIKKRTALAPGIYTRFDDVHSDRGISRVYKISSKPTYKKDWDLVNITQKVYDRRGYKHFSKAYDIAMFTAKKR